MVHGISLYKISNGAWAVTIEGLLSFSCMYSSVYIYRYSLESKFFSSCWKFSFLCLNFKFI